MNDLPRASAKCWNCRAILHVIATLHQRGLGSSRRPVLWMCDLLMEVCPLNFCGP